MTPGANGFTEGEKAMIEVAATKAAETVIDRHLKSSPVHVQLNGDDVTRLKDHVRTETKLWTGLYLSLGGVVLALCKEWILEAAKKIAGSL